MGACVVCACLKMLNSHQDDHMRKKLPGKTWPAVTGDSSYMSNEKEAHMGLDHASMHACHAPHHDAHGLRDMLGHQRSAQSMPGHLAMCHVLVVLMGMTCPCAR